jgi:hypothetical protein
MVTEVIHADWTQHRPVGVWGRAYVMVAAVYTVVRGALLLRDVILVTTASVNRCRLDRCVVGRHLVGFIEPGS